MPLFVRRPEGTKNTLARKIAIYAILFIALWSLLMFVVIPWESSGEIPEDSFELIEGQRAYAMVVREKRPTLATTIRGLNMVNAEFAQHKTKEGRAVITGNIYLSYDSHGEFVSLEIIKDPAAKAAKIPPPAAAPAENEAPNDAPEGSLPAQPVYGAQPR